MTENKITLTDDLENKMEEGNENQNNYNDRNIENYEIENEISSFRFNAIYQIPKPRQQWIDGVFVKTEVLEGSSKAEEVWVELFIDLVYVVLLYKLGELFTSCFVVSSSSSKIFLKVFIIFWSLCLTRMSIDEYANRFYSHDLAHKIFYLIYTSGVAVQVMNINTSVNGAYGNTDPNPSAGQDGCGYYSSYSVGIMCGILITRVALILIHLAVMYHNHKATDQFMFDIFRWSLSCLIATASIIIQLIYYQNETLDITLQAVIIGNETLTWLLSRSFFRHKYTFPIDLELLQSRWGVWIMIVIGESIIQLLLPGLSIARLAYNYLFDLSALILMFSLSMQYYDACQRAWFCHAITKSAIAGIIWIWLHLSTSFCLFGVGVGLKMAVKNYGLMDQAILAKEVLSTACGLVTMQLSVMRLSHSNFTTVSRRQAISFIYRFSLSVVQISAAYWSNHLTVFQVLLIQTLIAVFGFNLLDVLYEVIALSLDEKTAQGLGEKKHRKSRPFHQLALVNEDQEEGFKTYNFYASLKTFVVKLPNLIKSNDISLKSNNAIVENDRDGDSPMNYGNDNDDVNQTDKFVNSPKSIHSKSTDSNKNEKKQKPGIYDIIVPTPRNFREFSFNHISPLDNGRPQMKYFPKTPTNNNIATSSNNFRSRNKIQPLFVESIDNVDFANETKLTTTKSKNIKDLNINTSLTVNDQALNVLMADTKSE